MKDNKLNEPSLLHNLFHNTLLESVNKDYKSDTLHIKNGNIVFDFLKASVFLMIVSLLSLDFLSLYDSVFCAFFSISSFIVSVKLYQRLK
jgi:hypothetical protein